MKRDTPELDIAKLGQAVERELETSAIWRVVREAADAYAASALEELKSTDLTRTDLVARLVERFSYPDHLRQWVQAAIVRGQEAASALEPDHQ